MVTTSKLDPLDYGIISPKMWLLVLNYYTIGSDTYDNGTESARKAGYKGSNNVLAVNATRYLRLPKMQAAKKAIMAQTGDTAEFTADNYRKQLQEDRTFARENKQPSAMVSASVAMGRSCGYDKDNDMGLKDTPSDLSTEDIARLKSFSNQLLLAKPVKSVIIEQGESNEV